MRKLQEKLLSIKECQLILKAHDIPNSYPVVLGLLHDGKLRGTMYSGRWRVRRYDLDAYIQGTQSESLLSYIRSYGSVENIPKTIRVRKGFYGDALEVQLAELEKSGALDKLFDGSDEDEKAIEDEDESLGDDE